MKKALLLLLLAGMFASCSKSSTGDTPIDASKTKLLMDGRWQLKAYTVNPNINDSTAYAADQYSSMPGCVKDDYYIFNSPTTVTVYDGESKCSLAAPDSTVMGYQLTNNEMHMKIWSNTDDPEHSVILDGDVVYPSLDSFIVSYTLYDSATTFTSAHVKTFAKMMD